MVEKQVVKLERVEDKYMADAPEKFEEAMEDLDQDLNKEEANEMQQ